MLVGLIDSNLLAVEYRLEINCYCKTNVSGFDEGNVNCYECSNKEILNNSIRSGIDKTGSFLEIRLQDIGELIKLHVPSGRSEIALGYIFRSGEE